MFVKIIAPILVIGVSVFLFIFTYILDKRTPKPEGCEEESCEGCPMSSCSHRVSNKEEN